MSSLNSSTCNKVLIYIERYWDKITCYYPNDKQLHLGLPNKYVCPNAGIFKNDQFYWDSYFTILGLLKSGRLSLASGMVDNFVHLFRRFGIIPMRNRYYDLGTSQIPFLTSMALEVFNVTKDTDWLKQVMKVAEDELTKYWMNERLTEKHISYKGLSRYCDHYITHLGAEHESGWDMTSRFNDRCLDYLPIDLNTCLFKYEIDLAMACRLRRNYLKAEKFLKLAMTRRNAINKLMWNKKAGFFFDYNSHKQQQSSFYSIAGFYPLWAGLASDKQANEIRDKVLPKFEFEGGLVNTLKKDLAKDFKQHDYPNGWPHQQYIVIKGLLNYGFREDAERIANKWLRLNGEIFNETGKLWEKYDVVNYKIGAFNPDRYPTQPGFGWTNAIFLWLCSEFLETNSK